MKNKGIKHDRIIEVKKIDKIKYKVLLLLFEFSYSQYPIDLVVKSIDSIKTTLLAKPANTLVGIEYFPSIIFLNQ